MNLISIRNQYDLQFLNKFLNKIVTGKEYKAIVKNNELYKVFQIPFIIPKRLESIADISAILQYDTVSKNIKLL